MHDTGLSARVAGASSSSAAANAGDDDDESKTRKAHPAFFFLAAARLHCTYRAAASLLLLLAVASAAFLAGRARPRADCPPLGLDARFLALPDAASASDFGSLGVPLILILVELVSPLQKNDISILAGAMLRREDD